jgi:hypothetical protein
MVGNFALKLPFQAIKCGGLRQLQKQFAKLCRMLNYKKDFMDSRLNPSIHWDVRGKIEQRFRQ